MDDQSQTQLQYFSLQAFSFVIILTVYVFLSYVIQIKKVPYLHESSVAIIMGVITAIICKYGLQQQIQFSNQIFFTIILPPIVFSAGYSLRKSLFFQNFGLISFLGIIGTIIGFIFLTLFLILINFVIFKTLTLKQLMVISSVLCATDTVAAMSLIKPDKYPILNAVLFGESIINDAVAIILFGTITSLGSNSDEKFGFALILQMILDFFYLFFFSLALGMVSGLGLSYAFKRLQNLVHHPIKQTSLILLNGYFTYLLGQLLGLSGIITLFTSSIIMGHYAFKNISQQSQKGTGLAFESVSYMAQAFVFAYLGASMLSISGNLAAVGMGLLVLAFLPVVRAIMVYSLPLIYKIFKKEFPLKSKELKVCWYSGMIRGVIAFALCLQIKTKNRDFIITVSLVIVLITTMLGSAFLTKFIQIIKLNIRQSTVILLDKQNSSNKEIEGDFHISPQKDSNNKQDVQTQMKQFNLKRTKSQRISQFQQKYIKPIFEKPQKQQLTYQYEIDRNKQKRLTQKEDEKTQFKQLYKNQEKIPNSQLKKKVSQQKQEMWKKYEENISEIIDTNKRDQNQ